MTKLKNLFTSEIEDGEPCLGRVYRYEENNFVSGGRINMNVRFVPLKSLSCKGCEHCGGMDDWIDESCSFDMTIPYPQGLNHGDTVEMVAINDGRGFEDLYDEWHLELRKEWKR